MVGAAAAACGGPGSEGPRAVSFQDGLDHEAVAGWLAAEPVEQLEELDPEAALGRPPTAAGVRRRASDEACAARVHGAEVRGVRRVMIYDGPRPVGFSICALVQRPFGEAGEEAPACRICLEGGEAEELLEACACRGSARYVHGECLVMQWRAKWRATGNPGVASCGVCHQAFLGRAAGLLAAASGKLVDQLRKEEASKPSSEPQRSEEFLVAQISSATAMWKDGKLQEAARSFQESLKGLQELRGDRHAMTLTAHHNLGLVLQAQGKIDEAWDHIHAAATGFSDTFGALHKLTLKAQHNEGLIAQVRGQLEEAERVYAKVLEARTATLGGAHEDTLKTAGNLGLVLYSQRRTSEALPLLRETMQGLVHVLGRQHPLTLTVMQNLSLAMGDQEPASSEALRLGREAAEGKQLALGSENPDTLEGWRDLATLLERAGRWEEAERFLRQALAGQERLLGFNSKAAQQTLRQLSELLRRQGSAEEAEELRREHSVGVVVSAAPLPDPKHRGPLVLVLLALYVLPACRGCGIGRAAMELWKGFARGSAAAALELELKPAADCWGFFSEAVGMVGQRQQGTDGTAPAQLRYAL